MLLVTRAPRVALAHDFLIKLGGAERVLKTLSDMFPDAPIFTLFYDEKKVGNTFPREKIRGLPLQTAYKLALKKHRLLLPFMPTAIESLDFAGYDLVISSNTALMHGIITNLETKHICYCHSPARYLWDYAHKTKKENFGQNSLVSKIWTLVSHRLRTWDQAASKGRVDTWIANSKNVQQRIYKYFRAESELIYPPVEVNRFHIASQSSIIIHHSSIPYFLIVSTLAKYKHVEIAVELFNKLGRKLVIIGDGAERKNLENMANGNITFLGFQDDEIVTEYMQNCRALLFLSEDDFGITPIEAMACGKPVIAYGAGGALETVIPGETGELFTAQNAVELERGIAKYFIREKSYDPEKIREFAEQFSEKEFVKKMEKLIKNP